MTRFRNHGWEPNELKIYWNAEQLENLCPKHEAETESKAETKVETTDESKDETKVEAETESKDETKAETKVEITDEVKHEVQDETKAEAKVEKKVEAKDENLPPHDPSDADVILALRQYPVSNRNHDCTITYVNKGIEKAVFDAPEDAQLIVLNFAVSYFMDIVLDYYI